MTVGTIVGITGALVLISLLVYYHFWLEPHRKTLFAYGMVDLDILEEYLLLNQSFGCKHYGKSSLCGFANKTIISDGALQGLIPAEDNQSVQGYRYKISNRNLLKLDEHMGYMYKRVTVILLDRTEAETYVWADGVVK